MTSAGAVSPRSLGRVGDAKRWLSIWFPQVWQSASIILSAGTGDAKRTSFLALRLSLVRVVLVALGGRAPPARSAGVPARLDLIGDHVASALCPELIST